MTSVEDLPLLGLSAYELRQLAYHLAQAGLFKELHRLLALETRERRNLWYEARSFVNDLSGYIEDVTGAWRAAEAAYDGHDAEQAGVSVALQMRYALISSSLNSLSSNLSPAMLGALVRQGVRPPMWGLAYASILEDREQRAEALASLAPELPADLRHEVLRQVLSLLAESGNEVWRADVFASLGRHLCEPLKRNVLRQIFEPAERSYGAKELAALSPYLPAHLLEEAVAAAQKAGGPRQWAHLVAPLLPHLPDQMRTALVLRVLEEMRLGARGDDLKRLLPAFAPYAPGPALECLRALRPGGGDEGWRTMTLIALVPHVYQPPTEAVLIKALDMARAVEDERERAEALKMLAPSLTGGACDAALAAAEELSLESGRAEALAALTPVVPEPLLPRVFSMTRGISDPGHRARVLTALGPRLSQTFIGRTLGELGADVTAENAAELIVLTSLLHEPVAAAQFERALTAVQLVAGAHRRRAEPDFVTPLLKRLPETLLTREVEKVRLTRPVDYRNLWLDVLAPHLPPGLLRRASLVAQEIPYEESRPGALAALALRMPAPLQARALTAAHTSWLDYFQLTMTEEIGRDLAEAKARRSVGEVLSVAAGVAIMGVGQMRYWVLKLAPSVPHMPEWLRKKVLKRLGTHHLVEHCGKDDKMFTDAAALETLAGLAPYLSPRQRRRAMRATRTVEDDARRAHLRDVLSRRTSAHTTRELLLKHISAVSRAPRRSDEWSALTALLRDVLNSPDPEQLVDQTLGLLRVMKSYQERRDGQSLAATVLSHLAADFSERTLHLLLSLASEIEDDGARATWLRVLTNQAARLPAPTAHDLWRRLLPLLAARQRNSFLADVEALAPYVLALGGRQTAAGVFDSVQRVCAWWPTAGHEISAANFDRFRGTREIVHGSYPMNMLRGGRVPLLDAVSDFVFHVLFPVLQRLDRRRSLAALGDDAR